MLPTFRRFFSRDRKSSDSLRQLLGFRPRNLAIYRLALMHRSAHKHLEDGTLISNERLEFLGDAVLSSIVAKYLYHRYPGKDEGFLTEARSKLVSRKNLNGLAVKIGLTGMVLKDTGRNRAGSSLGGDALEAMIGAVFIDKGYPAAEKFVLVSLISNFIDVETLLKKEVNFKSHLIEWCQKQKHSFSFDLANRSGSGQRPTFTVLAMVDGKEAGKGKGRTKKRAEQQAAQQACSKLRIRK